MRKGKRGEWRCPVLRRSDWRRTSDGHGMGRDHHMGFKGAEGYKNTALIPSWCGWRCLPYLPSLGASKVQEEREERKNVVDKRETMELSGN